MTPLKNTVLKVLIGAAFSVLLVNSEYVELAISHCNDVSGQIEAFEKSTHGSSKAPISCTKEDGKDCIGGFTNLVHWLYLNKSEEFDFTGVADRNILRLSSGNIISGESGWISAVENGWSNYADRVKEFLEPRFMTAFGMKEFGAGLRQTNTFAERLGLDATVGVANTCDGDKEDYTETEEKFCELMGAKYIKHDLQNRTVTHDIGIIGFVTPTVERLSLPGNLKFSDIAETIKRITDEAKDIKTFIAIGDGNLNISKLIIDNAPKVKLVIYGSGFSNTSIKTYPLEYNKRFIATAGRYGSSVGKMHFKVDMDTGDIELINGQLIETETPQELNAEAKAAKLKIADWEEEVKKQKGSLIGNSRFELVGGETCWKEECNIGNLMTDAVVHCVLNRFNLTHPYPHVLHSIWHGGAFFEDTVNRTTVSEFDVHKWLPYHNNVHLVKVKGSNLKEVFKASATGIDPEKFEANNWRQFLQVSNGFEVFYDTTSNDPKVTIRIVHDDKGVPEFGDLNPNGEYHLAIPTYLYEGRGVYDFAKKFWTPVPIPLGESVFDDECLEGYIKAMRHISVGLEERIWVNKDNDQGGSTETPCTTTPKPTTDKTGTTSGTTEDPCPEPGPQPKPCPKTQKTAVTVTLTIVFYTMILAISYVGYFYVLPRLRRPPLSEQYPPNQL